MLSDQTKALIARHLSAEPPIDLVREVTRKWRAAEWDWGFASCGFITVGWGTAWIDGAFTNDPVFAGDQESVDDLYSCVCDLHEAITGEAPTFAGPITSALVAMLLKQLLPLLIERLNTIDWSKLLEDLLK